MLPFVVIGGLLMVRKLRRTDLVVSFLAVSLITFSGFILLRGQELIPSLEKFFLTSPIIFFAFVMLTEPLTTPPTKKLRMIYGALTGFLFAPQIHIGSIFSTPELSLLVGNVFSYIVSPKKKLLLTLKQKLQLGPDIINFVFTPDTKLNFTAGQYLEWTVGHHKPDNRGNRRYFTVASSPTESELILGAKFYDPASSFKRALLAMPIGPISW
jgi:Na+-transporting NADH:ubiquinone oxidoreductase subunit NqrB